MSTSSSIEALIARMEDLARPLAANGDRRRFFHDTYLRTTRAVGEEIERGGFVDADWTERWDVRFADLYLDALEEWDRGAATSRPWVICFEAAAERLPPLRHVLLGMNAHINYDLPQAVLAVITDEDFDDPRVVAKRSADHARIDEILVRRVPEEDRELAKDELPGDRDWIDRLLTPLNRAGTRRFLKEARRKVWANARILSVARRQGGDAYARRLAELEELSARRVADLRAPGRVLLKLAARGFGVELAQ